MTHNASDGDVSDLVWFKSSYSSGSEGDSCIEVAWRKSSYSSSSEGDSCVEVATTPATVHVRDSKVADGPQLAVGPGAWAGFVAYAVGV
ncbi:toxin [Streptomyces cinereoruber]|uniref:DUF397 domain-containing protein n=1 Tax=Streptomyces cinereoruber TaxID=67260 RepID=A0AAV4KJI8_9ACTN|nr:DUF397 domain-containing protein [Streptomyces cinereoruber]MBY8817768.1 DUF397 domain-containing protein [Streptomyces cinereoruber]QEV33655.1 DUF397 domain-containing protein [Streptomyces cinereoruber]GGR32140.1 toxin [Streptomyces cinereoruber]